MSVQRAPIRRAFDVRAKVTPPKPAPPEREKRRRRRPEEPRATCGLLVCTSDDFDMLAYRANKAGLPWSFVSTTGSRPVAELIEVINKGNRISYVSFFNFLISDDRGDTWAEHQMPISAFSHDRDAGGRYWVFADDDSTLYYSDDEGATWTPSGGALDTSTPWAVLCHPTDQNRIAAVYSNGDDDELSISVTTNRGGAWSTHTVYSASASGFAAWLPNGGLTALVIPTDFFFDEVYSTFSDDDGASWSSAVLEVTNPVPSGTRLLIDDLRVGSDGSVFALINRSGSPAAAVKILRSLDGATFEAIDPITSTYSPALAYCSATRNLYVGYRTDVVYRIPNARTLPAADWAGAAVALGGVIEGVIPVNSRHAFMVTI